MCIKHQLIIPALPHLHLSNSNRLEQVTGVNVLSSLAGLASVHYTLIMDLQIYIYSILYVSLTIHVTRHTGVRCQRLQPFDAYL